MLELIASDEYAAWLASLRDSHARGRILTQIQRIQLAEAYVGDWKNVGGSLVEIRISWGPGYRIYTTLEPGTLVLLTGGDKRTQARDIARAQNLLTQWHHSRNREGGN